MQAPATGRSAALHHTAVVCTHHRRATAADVPAVVTLVESAYRGDASRAGWTTEADLLHGQRTDVDAVSAAVSGAGDRVLLSVDDTGRLLGCCHLQSRANGVAYLGMFAVRPSGQGGGVGSALLAEAERVAAAEFGCTCAELTVITQRTELIAFYLRRGYRSSGERRPFPYGDERFGVPQRDDLRFDVLRKPLG